MWPIRRWRRILDASTGQYSAVCISLTGQSKKAIRVQRELIFIVMFFFFFRFYQNLQSALHSEKHQISDPPASQELQESPHRLETEKRQETKEKDGKNKTSVYQRRRKREKHHHTDCCHEDESGGIPELDDCLDMFTWGSSSAKCSFFSIDWTKVLFLCGCLISNYVVCLRLMETGKQISLW